MHTFQPYPVDMLDINPFTKLSKEWALVTAGDKEKSNTMTVSWGGTGVLWGKNVVFIFIRESRYTKDFIDNGEFFPKREIPRCPKILWCSLRTWRRQMVKGWSDSCYTPWHPIS